MPKYRNIRTGQVHETDTPNLRLERLAVWERIDDEPARSRPTADAPEPPEDDLAELVANGNADQVLEFVGDDDELASEAIALEEDGRARKSLLTKLSKIVAAAETDDDGEDDSDEGGGEDDGAD